MQNTPQRKDQLDSLAVTVLIACCLFWAAQQILIKATIELIPPVLQAGLRFIGASVLLWLWCRYRGIALFKPDLSLRAGLLAGFLFALEFAFLYLGMKFTNASRLTLFLYTAPFWVALLLPFFVKSERLSVFQISGLLLAFGAVGLALSEGLQLVSGDTLRGDVFALLAGLGWGLTTVIIRATPLGRCPAEKILLYQTAFAALSLPVISLLLGESWAVSWTPFLISSMLIQTFLGAFISYLTWMWLLTIYPAAKLSAFVFLTPVFTALLALWWLGEPIGLRLLLALCLVTVGIVMVNKR
jgi:drug/metabolite transporter (DMT)-like permease